MQLLIESSETNEGKCMFAYDIFKALERVVLDYVTDANDRKKYLEDLKIGKGLYREKIMTEMFNAYMDEPHAIRKDVMNYVNMIIGIDAENLGPDKMWKYRDPQTGELKALKIDERYISNVEERLGLKTRNSGICSEHLFAKSMDREYRSILITISWTISNWSRRLLMYV